MYENKAKIEGGLNAEPFLNLYYWSTTNNSSGNMYVLYMGEEMRDGDCAKSGNACIRCVRDKN